MTAEQRLWTTVTLNLNFYSQGAITGLLSGIGFALFLGFGQPKPVPPTKPFSLDDCTEFGGIRVFSNYSTTTTTIDPVSDMLQQRNSDDVEYIWLLKISYLWYGVVGFLITFIVGYVVSALLDLCNKGGSKKIYLDTKRRYIDTELFSPPVSKRLKRQNARFLERDSNVSILRLLLSCGAFNFFFFPFPHAIRCSSPT